MIKGDDLRVSGDSNTIWQKYCGFLDLSVQEFMEIQERLLLEEIELIANCPLGRKIMTGNVPGSVAEFRKTVPLTTYEDYAPYFEEKKEDALPEKPYYWCQTSGQGNSIKWIPYTQRAYERLIDNAMAAFILACTTRKGEVNLEKGDRVLYNLPARPYLSGLLAFGLDQRFDFQPIPPLELSEKMEFKEAIEESFKMALRTGVDVLGSMTSVLVKVGESFAERSGGVNFSMSMLHPAVFFRIARALLRSKLQRRKMLPKDLWPLKGIICWGTDTAIYRDQVKYYWGKLPYEFYARTETGILAMQSWTKEAMTFVPYSGFLEFIPEEEWLKSREDKDYHPHTVLLDEVEEGHRYELVITNFYGQPLLRYRPGNLIKIVSVKDVETGVNLPQMVYEGRADDILDIAGFTRLDEKTMWQAIANTGIRYEDWTVRKEYANGEPILHLYIESRDGLHAKEMEHLIHKQLGLINSDYRDLDTMLEVRPLRVTRLSRGSFERYYEEKQAASMDLAHLKPPHMNASDTVINNLLRLS